MIRVPLQVAKSGRVQLRLVQRQKSKDEAKEEASALIGARDALAELCAHAQRRRNRLAQTRKHEGDPAKRAFVYRLAEGWIFLTGKRPGRNFDPSRNPFLRFVIAAWTDAGFDSDGEDFSSALDSTLKMLQEHENWPWSELSRETVSGIAARGPAWM
jgi:hypothetical protein